MIINFLKILINLIVVFVIFLPSGCGNENDFKKQLKIDKCENVEGKKKESDYVQADPFYFNTLLIETETPRCYGDVSSTPSFKWKTTGQKLIFLAVYSLSDQEDPESYDNISVNIWAWYSGLNEGKEGEIAFLDGVNVIDKKLDDTLPPIPLESGKIYKWAIWAWDDEGINITRSSQEIYFQVK